MKASVTLNKAGKKRMKPTVQAASPRQSRGREKILRHQVREQLEARILSGEFTPGSRLGQQELAQRFGVGAGVVREALLELQACGLVETKDNRGAYVSQIDKQTLLDAFDVREVHEGLAARLCCLRSTRAEIAELREIAYEIHELTSTDMGASAEKDKLLHHRLLEIADHAMLLRLADNYRVLTKVFHVGHLPLSKLPPKLLRTADTVLAEHINVLEAIEKGREDDAERLMRAHVHAGKEEAERLIEAGLVLHWLP